MSPQKNKHIQGAKQKARRSGSTVALTRGLTLRMNSVQFEPYYLSSNPAHPEIEDGLIRAVVVRFGATRSTR